MKSASLLLLVLLSLVLLLLLKLLLLLALTRLLAFAMLLPSTCAHFCSIAASVAALIGQKYMRCCTALLLLLLWRLVSCGSSGCCSSCMAGPVMLRRRKSVAEDSSNRRQLVKSLQAQHSSDATRIVFQASKQPSGYLSRLWPNTSTSLAADTQLACSTPVWSGTNM